ncbi:Aminoglycoside N(6')-acetyltransferase type 1 [Pontiella desulfatans]|uniref:Aminoglycoside N(6')-acetyltransferase type 1 n=1 Tax=Pontiella desulfatans TaxID=2750659 RepID=A0A6C2U9C6_PONDE|nr:GNAT family N-acetyltransferase [Pontiella desulfatans]VGO15984.1 Aminoglycoside N(6')-acetyltransferase type 1 [Pontiella desulfatans]
MTQIILADLSDPSHARAVLHLLNEYATDCMGGGEELSGHTRKHLIAELGKRVGCRVVLAFIDGLPAGLAICFENFSTFLCAPILNIHDFTVAPEFRGRGLSKQLLAKVEEIAKKTACCKITLEVLEGNTIARAVYSKFGFEGYELDPEMGKALFYEKKLGTNVSPEKSVRS